MIPGWIPANWRDGRLIYSLQFEPGPWVDIAHSNTLAALNGSLGSLLYEVEVEQTLTLTEVTQRPTRSHDHPRLLDPGPDP